MIDRPSPLAKGFAMKKIQALVIIVSLAIVTSLSIQSASADELFRHFVSFQFNEDTTEDQTTEIIGEFMALKNKIDTIVAIEWGTSENIEPRNDGFTHSFLVTFKNKEGLETYLPHPEHEKFKKLIKPQLKKVYVFDYTPRD